MAKILLANVSNLLLSSNFIVVNNLQPKNGFSPINVTLAGIVISVRAVQFLKALVSIVFKLEFSPKSIVVINELLAKTLLANVSNLLLSSNFTIVNILHPKNGFSPIVVTLAGIVISVSPVQFLNALLSIVFILEFLPKSTIFIYVLFAKILFVKTSKLLLSSNLIVLNDLHCVNIFSPIVVTLAGIIVISFNEKQF